MNSDANLHLPYLIEGRHTAEKNISEKVINLLPLLYEVQRACQIA